MDDWNLDRLGEESGDEDEGTDVTWSFSGNTGTVFLIDAAKEMFDRLPGEEEEDTPFTRAIKAVHASMMRKAISKPYDLMAVVFFNTREAKNPLGYSSVYVLQELQRPSAENVLAMEEFIDMKDSQFETKFGHSITASIHDSLRTCQSVFNTSEKRHAGRSILLFTCRDDPHAGDDQRRRQAVTKAKDLKESSIALEILHMGTSFDVTKFYKDLILPDDTEEEEQQQGEELTRERRTLANPTTRFEELMKRVSQLENKQRVAGKLVFTLAPGITVAVGIYSVVKKSRKPTKKRLWKNTNQELKSIHKDYLMDTGELVSRSDYEYYQKYGNRKIGLTMDEAQNIGNVYKPGMQLLGFKPFSWLKNIYYYKEAKFIYPKEEMLKGSTKVFTALLERCQARNMIALVRLVVRQRTSVALAALVPQKEVLDETNAQMFPPGFLVYHLPFADNFGTVEIKSRSRAKERQVDAAKRVIKKLQFEYQPENFDNPDIETMWEIIKALALNRSQLEPVVDYTVPNNEQMEKRAGPQLREFDRLVFTSTVSQSAKIQSATSALLASKRVKIDNDNLDVETMVRRGQAQQLTVPVLKSWLTARGMSITGKKKAELMQAVIDAVCA